MNISQMLQQTGAVEAISRELGVDATTAQAGAAALLPSILSGFQYPVAASEAQGAASAFPDMGALGGLIGSIGDLGGGGLLDNVTSNDPTEIKFSGSFSDLRTAAGLSLRAQLLSQAFHRHSSKRCSPF
jgi:hypothetical protein